MNAVSINCLRAGCFQARLRHCRLAIYLVAFPILACAICNPLFADRVWTSKDGKPVTARLLGVFGGNAQLCYDGDNVASVSHSQLSDDDQKFLLDLQQYARNDVPLDLLVTRSTSHLGRIKVEGEKYVILKEGGQKVRVLMSATKDAVSGRHKYAEFVARLKRVDFGDDSEIEDLVSFALESGVLDNEALFVLHYTYLIRREQVASDPRHLKQLEEWCISQAKPRSQHQSSQGPNFTETARTLKGIEELFAGLAQSCERDRIRIWSQTFQTRYPTSWDDSTLPSALEIYAAEGEAIAMAAYRLGDVELATELVQQIIDSLSQGAELPTLSTQIRKLSARLAIFKDGLRFPWQVKILDARRLGGELLVEVQLHALLPLPGMGVTPTEDSIGSATQPHLAWLLSHNPEAAKSIRPSLLGIKNTLQVFRSDCVLLRSSADERSLVNVTTADGKSMKATRSERSGTIIVSGTQVTENLRGGHVTLAGSSFPQFSMIDDRFLMVAEVGAPIPLTFHFDGTGLQGDLKLVFGQHSQFPIELQFTAGDESGNSKGTSSSGSARNLRDVQIGDSGAGMRGEALSSAEPNAVPSTQQLPRDALLIADDRFGISDSVKVAEIMSKVGVADSYVDFSMDLSVRKRYRIASVIAEFGAPDRVEPVDVYETNRVGVPTSSKYQGFLFGCVTLLEQRGWIEKLKLTNPPPEFLGQVREAASSNHHVLSDEVTGVSAFSKVITIS